MPLTPAVLIAVWCFPVSPVTSAVPCCRQAESAEGSAEEEDMSSATRLQLQEAAYTALGRAWPADAATQGSTGRAVPARVRVSVFLLLLPPVTLSLSVSAVCPIRLCCQSAISPI